MWPDSRDTKAPRDHHSWIVITSNGAINWCRSRPDRLQQMPELLIESPWTDTLTDSTDLPIRLTNKCRLAVRTISFRSPYTTGRVEI